MNKNYKKFENFQETQETQETPNFVLTDAEIEDLTGKLDNVNWYEKNTYGGLDGNIERQWYVPEEDKDDVINYLTRGNVINALLGEGNKATDTNKKNLKDTYIEFIKTATVIALRQTTEEKPILKTKNVKQENEWQYDRTICPGYELGMIFSHYLYTLPSNTIILFPNTFKCNVHNLHMKQIFYKTEGGHQVIDESRTSFYDCKDFEVGSTSGVESPYDSLYTAVILPEGDWLFNCLTTGNGGFIRIVSQGEVNSQREKIVEPSKNMIFKIPTQETATVDGNEQQRGINFVSTTLTELQTEVSNYYNPANNYYDAERKLIKKGEDLFKTFFGIISLRIDQLYKQIEKINANTVETAGLGKGKDLDVFDDLHDLDKTGKEGLTCEEAKAELINIKQIMKNKGLSSGYTQGQRTTNENDEKDFNKELEASIKAVKCSCGQAYDKFNEGLDLQKEYEEIEYQLHKTLYFFRIIANYVNYQVIFEENGLLRVYDGSPGEEGTNLILTFNEFPKADGDMYMKRGLHTARELITHETARREKLKKQYNEQIEEEFMQGKIRINKRIKYLKILTTVLLTNFLIIWLEESGTLLDPAKMQVLGQTILGIIVVYFIYLWIEAHKPLINKILQMAWTIFDLISKIMGPLFKLIDAILFPLLDLVTSLLTTMIGFIESIANKAKKLLGWTKFLR